MKASMIFASNPFNDPSDPMYYVIGVVFLVLLIGALVAYMLISKKREQAKSEKTENDGSVQTDKETDNAEENDASGVEVKEGENEASDEKSNEENNSEVIAEEPAPENAEEEKETEERGKENAEENE